MISKRDVMKPEKPFDCVAMKTEIQERLLREVNEFGQDEARSGEWSTYLAIQYWVASCR